MTRHIGLCYNCKTPYYRSYKRCRECGKLIDKSKAVDNLQKARQSRTFKNQTELRQEIKVSFSKLFV